MDASNPNLGPQFRRAHELWGAGNIDRAFPDGALSTVAPFPQAPRRKSVKDYDPDIVTRALTSGNENVQEVDPRTLHRTQPSVTRAGVKYYQGDEYRKTGRTFADQDNAGNQVPVVYRREGQNILLSGHHRATAALLNGEMLKARVEEGPWGPKR